MLLEWSISLDEMAESFGKFGFNNGSYNPNAFKNPTDSYASLFGAMEFDVKAQNGLNASLGGAINALVYDSTFSQGGEFLGNGYIGAWFGYKGDKAMEARQYILHNAFVGYDGSILALRLGDMRVVGWTGLVRGIKAVSYISKMTYSSFGVFTPIAGLWCIVIGFGIIRVLVWLVRVCMLVGEHRDRFYEIFPLYLWFARLLCGTGREVCVE